MHYDVTIRYPMQNLHFANRARGLGGDCYTMHDLCDVTICCASGISDFLKIRRDSAKINKIKWIKISNESKSRAIRD